MDASRNGHFKVNQSCDPDFNATVGETKPTEQAIDILMLNYPRNDDNRYLNFITSVEDVGSNMDSLPLDDVVKIPKSTEDAHSSVTSGEDSIREPLALPGTPRGVVIEEVTSLDGTDISSESIKRSATPKASLDTNSSVPLEDEKNDLGMSPSITDVIGDRKHIDGGTDRQKLGKTPFAGDGDNLGNVEEANSHANDASERSSDGSAVSRKKHVDEERNEEA